MSKTTSSPMKRMEEAMYILYPWFGYDTYLNDVKLKLLIYLYPSTDTDLTRCVEHQYVKRKCVKSKIVNVELAGSGEILCYGFDLSKVHTFVDLQQQLHKLLPKYNRDICDPEKIRLFNGHDGTKEVKSLQQAIDCNLLVLTPVKSRVKSLLKKVKEGYEKNVFVALEKFLEMCFDSESGRVHRSYDTDALLRALKILKNNQVHELKQFQDLVEYQQKELEQCKDNCSVCGKTLPPLYQRMHISQCRGCCKRCVHCGHPKTRNLKPYYELMNGTLDHRIRSLMTKCSSFCVDFGEYAQCDTCGKMRFRGDCGACNERLYDINGHIYY